MKNSIFFVGMLFTGVAVGMGKEAQDAVAIPKSPRGQSTLLIDAIKDGKDITAIKAILDANPGSLNDIDSMGRTALSWAFSKDDDKHFNMIILLQGKQADVNAGRGKGKPIFIVLERLTGAHTKERDLASLLVCGLKLDDTKIYCSALLSGLSPHSIESLVKKGVKKCAHAGHQGLLTPALQRSKSAKKFFPDEDEKTPYKAKAKEE